jgi:hypothetical protein
LRGAAPYRLEARVVATYRAQETIRQELAERLGVQEVPAELPAGAALQLARWQASLSGAEERLDRLLLEPGAAASDRLEGAIAVRTLREELADAAREHGLVLREAVPGVAPDAELMEAGVGDARLASAGLADAGRADAGLADARPGNAGLAEAEREHGLVLREEVLGAAPAGLADAGEPMTPAEQVAEGLPPSRGSEGEPERPEAWAVAGQPAGWPGARSMETGGDEGLVAAYDEAPISRAAERHAAGWREQLAVELGLEGREAALRVSWRRSSVRMSGLRCCSMRWSRGSSGSRRARGRWRTGRWSGVSWISRSFRCRSPRGWRTSRAIGSSGSWGASSAFSSGNRPPTGSPR